MEQEEKKERPYGAKLYSEILEQGLHYVEQRMQGKVRSFKTPWDGLNDSGLNGIDWGSMITIGARPGSGKTMLVNQILGESKKNNPDQDFNILEFQFEMRAETSAGRAFAVATGLDYNQVLSSYKQLDAFSYELMKKLIQETKELESKGVYRIQVTKPLSAKEIEKAIYLYYEKLGSKPLIVTIDHSWLIKKGADEKEKIQTLYNTTEYLMNLKNNIPVIIFMITQLNRSMDDPNRKVPGSIVNYPTSTDIFGGDALMQGSDMVLVMNRPEPNGVSIYGNKGYIMTDTSIALHIIKNRHSKGDNSIIFLEAQYHLGRAVETIEPQVSNPSGLGYNRLSNQKKVPNLKTGAGKPFIPNTDIQNNL